MSKQSLGLLMLEILSLKGEINTLFSAHNNGVMFFNDVSLPIPVFKPAELGFLRIVSWLYVLYIEAGKVNIEVISLKFKELDNEYYSEHIKHLDIVNKLRTYLQHNLDPHEKRNLKIQQDCEKWFFDNAATSVPKTEKQWKECSVKLLRESVIFLNAVVNKIREIEGDSSKDLIISDWNNRIQRRHAPHEFDRLIEIVSADMGRDNIDAVRLRKRYYGDWIKSLEFLAIGYDFETEARKLIEHILLFEVSKILPITGKDIIEEFNIKPGSEVGRILEIARTIYENQYCSKVELLEQISHKLLDDAQ